MKIQIYFRALVILVTFFGNGSQLAAQELMFRTLTVNDGLSVSHVSVIAQDSLGFLWFGTAGGGLNRYDGYTFQVFRNRKDDPLTLSSNTVMALHVDVKGTLWVGTDRGLDRFDPISETFERFMHDPETDTTIGPGAVQSIASESSGRVWVASNDIVNWLEVNATVSRLDPSSGTATRFKIGQQPANNVPVVFVDSTDTIWAGVGHFEERRATPDHGLYRLDELTDSFVRDSTFLPKGTSLGITAIVEDAGAGMWIGTWGRGLVHIRPDGAAEWHATDDSDPNSFGGNYVVDLSVDDRGKVWAVTLQGSWESLSGQLSGFLNEVDPSTGSTTRFGRDPVDPNALGEYYLRSVFLDSFGTVWVGTSGAGIRYADTVAGAFLTCTHNPSHNESLIDSFVRSVFVSDVDHVWVGTALGLNLVDRQTRTVRRWRHKPGQAGSLGKGSVEALLVDHGGSLWVGGVGGLFLFQEKSDSFHHFADQEPGSTDRDNLIVVVIRETRDKMLLIGTDSQGLKLFDPQSGRFSSFRGLRQGDDAYLRRISSIEQGTDGIWWIGGEGGLTRFDRHAGTSDRFSHDPTNPNSISSNRVSAIFVAPSGNELWIGTRDAGLNRLDLSTGEWGRFDLDRHGVADNLVYAVQGDRNGVLWLSTNHGLVRFDPETLSTKIYGTDRGIQAPEFNHRAATTAPDGRIFFGGVNGLTSFHPDRISDNPKPPRIVITQAGVLLRDSPSSGTSSFEAHPHGSTNGQITLDHQQRDVVFDYVALHTTDPRQHLYSVRLDGFESAWRMVGNLRRATYTNLEPGSYTFKVRATNAHGVWSESNAELEFTIRSPFWATWWFRLIATAGLMAALGSAYRWRLRTLERRENILEERVEERTEELQEALEMIEAQARRLSELDEAKSRFFANVSHEFRTPLTLTIGPLEDLRDGFYGELPGSATNDIIVAIRNARRLLRLVNQMLDMAKLEAGHLQPCMGEADLHELLNEVVQSFSPLAERRNIKLQPELGGRPVVITADAEMLDQVFTNLLSNAFKFTSDGGKIRVHIREVQARGLVTVDVQDSGRGIPPDLLPHIFDRFHSAAESATELQVGTGIGLALAKELVELHEGEITVRSVEGLGTTMSIVLKTDPTSLVRDADAKDPIVVPPTGLSDVADPVAPKPGGLWAEQASRDPADPVSLIDSDSTTILVVDDSDEIRAHVRKHLEGIYRVIEAEDGLQGLELIRGELPDVVISDVVMPRMDGVEMCRQVKLDPETDFIPIVLLTARASEEHRIEGLELGADDYLSKPFSARELKARVANFIAARSRLEIRLQSKDEEASPTPAVESRSRFVEKLFKIIDERLSDCNFDIETLAEELHMSRVHLYRRMAEELDQHPGALLMQKRLDRAADLLKENAGSVSEIAYTVGFKSVSHFSKRFRLRFEETPSAFRSKQKYRSC